MDVPLRVGMEVGSWQPTRGAGYLSRCPYILRLATAHCRKTSPGATDAQLYVHEWPNPHPTWRIDRIEVTVLRTGRVTEALHGVEPGAELGLRGPFGKGYPLDKLRGSEVLLVGGGVGLAPLRSLFYALLHNAAKYKKIIVLNGARTTADLVYRPLYDGWRKKKNNSSVVMCL